MEVLALREDKEALIWQTHRARIAKADISVATMLVRSIKHITGII
jgi:hypothetical protein